jgi:hypothetical protein
MLDPSQNGDNITNNHNNDAEDIVTVRSRDGVTFQFPAEAVNLSEIVKNDGESTCVLDFNAAVLADVVTFLTQYEMEPMKEIQTPLRGRSFDEIVTQEWYREFLRTKPQERVFDLFKVANVMKIKPLLNLTCLKFTFELNSRSAEEIRDIINLPAMIPE